MRLATARILASLLIAGPAVEAGAAAPEAAATGEAETGAAGAEAAVVLEVFTQEGCPRCAEAAVFLRELERRRPEVRIVVRDVGDPAARGRLMELADRAGVQGLGVPAFAVGEALVIGYSAAGEGRIEALLGGEGEGEGEAGACGLEAAGPACGAGAAAGDTVVTAPLLGEVSLRRLGLPLFTLALGLVDGFNPCAMWVLVFLLSILASLGSRRKMAAIGGTFVVVSGLCYLAFMAAWLNVFLLIGASRAVQATLGGLALVAGGVHVKDFFAPGRGPSLSIPAAAKPTIYARVRGIVRAERMAGAIAGAAVLAALVNLVELLCTAGLPAIFTQVLSAQGLSGWGRAGYLGLYIAAYMFDDAVMVGIAVATLSRQKLQERAGRQLKLVSGAVMIALGVVLLAAPEWLTL